MPVFKWRDNETIATNSDETLKPNQVADFVIWMHEAGTIRKLDPHLRPQHLLCDFCVGDIDLLGKAETRDRDFARVTRKLGLEHVWKIETRENISGEEKNKDCNFYNQLNDTQLDKLKRVYKVDFEMFGYDLKSMDHCRRRL